MGDQKNAEVAAKLWRFGPKAWKPYFNIRDPQEIERRANAEVPIEKVTEGWPISTDPDVHVKKRFRNHSIAAQPKCTFTPASQTRGV